MQRRIEDLHLPVLREECVQLLAPALSEPGAVMIDATVGLGGHAESVLEACPEATVVGIDRDPEALALAGERLARFGERFVGFLGTFEQIDEVAELYGTGGLVDAILMDLGVSSLQLDDPGRGFAYAQDGPLDMRMSQVEEESAAALLSRASASELTRILRQFGEERFASRIAAAIVRQREVEPIRTTGQLAELVKNAIPAPARRRGGNPAKRTFQAVRIAVNDELGILERTLPKALASLRVGGRLVVESYQSLEDRIVKGTLKEGLETTAPPDLPFVPEEDEPRLRALRQGAMKADEEEITINPRARSVRLRAVELVRPWRPQ